VSVTMHPTALYPTVASFGLMPTCFFPAKPNVLTMSRAFFASAPSSDCVKTPNFDILRGGAY
jgi:hypothetical protein